MTGPLGPGPALAAIVLGTVALAAVYRNRVTMPRPPVGRFAGSDIVVMLVVLVVLPVGYLHMPGWLVATVFGLVVCALVRITLAPVAGGRSATAVAVLLCGAAVAAAVTGWDAGLLLANGLAVVVLTVGVTNLWVQAGMTPGHVAMLAAALAGYDTLATGVGTLTADFMARVEGLPFAPLLVTRSGPDPVAIGLGDCLMLTVWPLVAARTYGRTAGRLAVAVDAAVLVVLLIGFRTGVLVAAVPVLTLLGPLIVLQYLCWRRRPGATSARAELTANLPAVEGLAGRFDPGIWVALHEGRVVGTGTSPGSALRSARRTGLSGTPVTALVPESPG